MNFGITLAAGKVKGVRVDLAGVMGDEQWYEPESAEAALEAWAAVLLPERDLDDTLDALRPLVGRPDVAREIRERSESAARSQTADDEELMEDDLPPPAESEEAQVEPKAPMTLSQIVGLILGSPEFQRR
jgi:hypothetical protein